MRHKNFCVSLLFCLLTFIICQSALAVEPPENPINELTEVWEKKVVSTASGMIHIQWRYEGVELPDSFRIYRGEGEENPFSAEETLQQTTPWRIDISGQSCFFRFLPEDEEEGKEMWLMVRAVKNGEESNNLDAESVIVDLPWINGLNDPNFMNFYVVDDKRSDSFLQETPVCPFCGKSCKIYFRLAWAYLAEMRDHAWYYIDPTLGLPEYMEDVANCFESQIYPTNLETFGRPDSEWTDVDENGHIIILFTGLSSNIAGYFDIADKFAINQNKDYIGNYADMFYISSGSSLKSIKRTIAHEFQHMQHFEANAEKDGAWEELWLDEACSEFAEEVNNLLDVGKTYWDAYQKRPNEISLTRFGFFDVHERFGGCPIHWDEDAENYEAFRRVMAHYNQVAIWAHYMEYNASPMTLLASLVEDPNTGIISVQNHLGKDFQEVFTHWTIANYVSPYAYPEDTLYHYNAQFPNGAELIATHQVDPTATLSPELVKDLEQLPSWQEGSLRDLTADYVLFPHNGLLGNHIHWEVSEVHEQENHCHVAFINQTDPCQPVLHEVVNLSILDSTGDITIFEGEKDLSSCLIVTNVAQYKDTDYESPYKYRGYLTQNPRIVQIKLNQDQNEWLLGDSPVRTKAGLIHVDIQFDQSMSETAPSHIFIDPQGGGAGEGPIAFQPASVAWSQIVYPADTWSGTVMIPENNSEQWDGLADIVISGVRNVWEESLEGNPQFSFFIDTQTPSQVTNLSVYFVDETVEIRWNKNTESDLLGYNLYGIYGENEPLWIPLEGLNDPNSPLFSLSNPDHGIYEFTLTALNQAGNEGPSSEKVGLAIQYEIPLYAGQNIVSYPIQPPTDYNSENLLTHLGISTNGIRRYVPELSVYQTSYWDNGIVQGIFPIIQDEGYIIYQHDAGCLTLSGPIKDRETHLYAGKNLIGIPFLSLHETPLDVFQNLLKNGETISSLQYYQPQTGKWTGCYDFFGKKSGPYTEVIKGLGYLIYIRNLFY